MVSDLNGFLEFADDDRLTGFRLKKAEVYNWGTFHDRIWELPLDGHNGLLTGDIGSGKSTIVDAVTTLLVPSNRVSYNRAAGAERKERSLRSYVQGFYKSERSDGGYSAKPVALRERNSYSVILGVFANVGYNQNITLAQVFWQKELTGQPARFYIVADCELSIREHFSNFGSDITLLKKKLRTLEHVEPPFDTFPPYGAAFRRRFGLKSEQALDLFHQTVSLKSIGNLTGFVRENMLEAFDTAPRIEELIRHFDDLHRAHEAVIRARTQIERLKPLCGNLVKYAGLENEAEILKSCRDGLSFWFANEKSKLLTARINKQQLQIEKQIIKSQGIKENLDSMRGERDDLKQAIAESGGNHLEKMKSEIKTLENDKLKKLERFDKYSKFCVEIGLREAKNSDTFIENQKVAAERMKVSISRSEELQNKRTENEVKIRSLKERHDELSIEIESLKKRRSNINLGQIKIRDRICDELDLPENTLPFVGELIAVRDEESQWEGAIERVLHNFALSLLVPEHLYTKISEWVDKTNLRGRIVYYKVSSDNISRLERPVADSLPAKVKVKTDSSYQNWLEQQLRTRFDYVCCEELEMFRKLKKGLTRFGQIKGSTSRHEKDDRHDIYDRSRYVLGWTNQAKLKTLEKKKKELENQIFSIAGELTDINAENKNLEENNKKLTWIEMVSNWDELDWHSLAKRVDHLTKEVNKLERSSDRLRILNESLVRLEADISKTEGDLEFLNNEIATLKERCDNLSQQLDEAQNIVKDASISIDEIGAILNPLVESVLPGIKLSVDNCAKNEKIVRESLQAKIDAINKRMKSLSEKIVSAMTDFRKDYPSVTRDFDAVIDAGSDYTELLKQLEADDLPSFEARFKRQLNENTIREIASFQAQLNKEYHKIEERIEHINKSMSAIEYYRDRYIKLETMQTVDQEIRAFKQDLRSCTEGSLADSGSDVYTEEKFIQVKSIVDRFRGREGSSEFDKRWTDKVTDVRNWFEFAASERWIEDNSEYEHYTDSGGKSGGQKEKLAYTILAASLAYQFGLELGEVRSRSFRFVVIDEAFGRGSDESTRYALKLFRQLNLQFLLITPLQKINIIEPYVSTVGFVYSEDGKSSLLRSITIEQYRSEKAEREAAADVDHS